MTGNNNGRDQALIEQGRMERDVEYQKESGVKAGWVPVVAAKFIDYAESELKDYVLYVLGRGSEFGERGEKLYGLDEKGQVINHKDMDIVIITKPGVDKKDLKDRIAAGAPDIPQEILDIDPKFAYECEQGNIYSIDEVLQDLETVGKLEEKETAGKLENGDSKMLKKYREDSYLARALNRVILFENDIVEISDSDKKRKVDEYMAERRKKNGRPMTFVKYLNSMWMKAAGELMAQEAYKKELDRTNKAMQDYAAELDNKLEELEKSGIPVEKLQVDFAARIDNVEAILEAFNVLYSSSSQENQTASK